MGRREQILDTAIGLFNESGTASVSTNHIAAAMGISPGNLYYHFRKKEEIIRAIHDRLRPEWTAANALPTDEPLGIHSIRRILEANAEIVWAYRFYYRELPALLRRDPELAVAYREVRQTGLSNVAGLLSHFVATGLMTGPREPRAIQELARVCWLLAELWLPFAEMGDEPVGPECLSGGVTPILLVLDPYFTEQARAELAASSTST